jgi:hypothetical protein
MDKKDYICPVLPRDLHRSVCDFVVELYGSSLYLVVQQGRFKSAFELSPDPASCRGCQLGTAGSTIVEVNAGVPV